MLTPLDTINIGTNTQARACIDQDTVSDYAERMEEGDEFPPVVLFRDGSDTFLADGFHRVLAAERVGYKEIDADVRKGTREDALWFAIGANKANGQRMNRGDVRRAVELALKTWPEKTQRMVADQVGCSQSMVAYVKKELIDIDKLDEPPTRKGADGKERKTTYNKREEEPEIEEDDEGEDEMADGPIDPLDTTHMNKSDKPVDSVELINLKRYWRRAKKKDKKEFRRWIDEI